MSKSLTGIVSSASPNKTIIVTVSEHKTHPLYHKQYLSTKKYMAHDEKNEAVIGDKVVIAETRPLSARKHFRMVSIINRAPVRHVENTDVAEVNK